MNQTFTLPSALERKLRAVRRRSVLLASARGAAVGCSALLIAMIVAMTVDWIWTLFDPVMRTAMTLSSLTIAAAVWVFATNGPIRRAMRWSHAARVVDASVPQLQQRWTTIADFAHGSVAPTSSTAQSMLDQVASEAVAMQSMVQPDKIASTTSLRPAGLGLTACLVASLAFLAVQWDQTSILLQRFWFPMRDITATQVVSVTGDRVVPRGEAIKLVTNLSGLARTSAELTIQFPSGAEEVFTAAIDKNGGDMLVHSMRVDETLRYRIRAGDGQTQWHSLQVIDYPEISDVRFTLTAPEYVDSPIIEKKLIPRRIKVIGGTQLSLAIKPKDPLQRLVITLMKADPANPEKDVVQRQSELAAGPDGWYRYECQLVESVTLRPTLCSPEGLIDEAKAFCRIQVISDQAPVARIIRPTDEQAVAVDDVLEIEYEAHDDHGISTAELIVYDDANIGEDGEPTVIATKAISLGDQRLQKHLTGSVQLDLKELGLQSGTSISYSIRVTDNRGAALAGAELEPETASGTPPEDPMGEKNLLPFVHGPETVKAAERGETRQAGSKQEPEAAEIAPRSPGPSAAAPVDLPETPIAERASATKTGDADQPSEPTISPTASPTASTVSRQAGASPLDRGTADDGRDPPQPPVAMLNQQQSGQNTETGRRRLKITERLSAIAAADGRLSEQTQIRERVVAIDTMLAGAQTASKTLVDHGVPDVQRGEQFKRLDAQLGDIEKYTADLRSETKDNAFAFVGLQMVDIARAHVTPARDRVFAGTRRPNASDVDAKVAMGHILRARELLAVLLSRYDRVKQDRDLNRSLEEAATMYEVYVEKSYQLMREARQNRNPLARKMAVVEVDQEYLDRLAEVLALRTEMMDEFGRLLADDPRLLSRYLDLIKRRQRSLRDQLSDLAERQDDAAVELNGWLQIDEEQKDALWTIIRELRLHGMAQLAKDAAELAERIERQMPLEVEPEDNTPAKVILHGKQIAQRARLMSLNVEQAFADEGSGLPDQLQHADDLVVMFGQLDAALDRLQFEHENEAEFTAYVQSRLLESRTVADQAEAWAILVRDLAQRSYGSIVSVEQHAMAIATELLRTEMLGIEADLQGQFQRQAEASVPAEIIAMVHQLHQLMESITFNQAAASYAAGRRELVHAAQQQQLALERFDRAEELFDSIRRSVAEALDAYAVQNPNIADLRDPTLDAFFARLEREPSIAARLGIPNRPRNLRVIADSMLWQLNGDQMLGSSGEAAMRRAKQAMQRFAQSEQLTKSPPGKEIEGEQTETERQQLAAAKEAQELLEKALLAIEEQSDDQATTPQQRRLLEEVAASLKQVVQQSGDDATAKQVWQQIAQSAEAEAILAALARGEAVPDQQWNKLLSTLEDGLWQVRGKKPPEEYRQAIQQYQDQIRELTGSIDDV